MSLEPDSETLTPDYTSAPAYGAAVAAVWLPPIAPTAAGDQARAEAQGLNAAGTYQAVRRVLSRRGIGSIIWGVICALMGLAAAKENPINIVLAGIGLMLFIEGFWLVLAPSPIGMIIDGCALLVVAFWNLGITVMSMSAGGGSGTFGAFGVLQFIWAVRSFSRYSWAKAGMSLDPGRDATNTFNEMTTRLRKSNRKSDAQVAEFQIVQKGAGKNWKAGLWSQVAVFSFAQSSFFAGTSLVNLFAAKSDVVVASMGIDPRRNSHNVNLIVNGTSYAGRMSSEAFDRFSAWKGAA